VKEDHRQRTTLDGRGSKVPGYRCRAVHHPANCSGEKKDLTSGRLARLACRFHQLYNQNDQISPSATLVVK
jgi:hypothetical protein